MLVTLKGPIGNFAVNPTHIVAVIPFAVGGGPNGAGSTNVVIGKSAVLTINGLQFEVDEPVDVVLLKLAPDLAGRILASN